MVRSASLRTVSALTLASALLLAGCSSDSDEASSESTASPLEEYMGALWETDDAATMMADQVEIENLVATCMSEKGFEYIPREISEKEFAWVEDMESVDRETAEWVAENGYGMSSQPESTEVVDEAPVDPNMDYVTSLSPSAQTAYNEALYGPDVWSEMTEEEAMEYEYKWEDAGCQGAAQHEIDQSVDVFSDPAHAELMEAMNSLWEDQQSDPRMTTLNTKWADCMADAGYTDFATPDDAMTSVMDAQNALWENMDIDEESLEAPVGPSEETLAEVRELEIATAKADFACKEETKYTDEMKSVQYELEKKFVTDHKAQLDALVAAVESGKSE